MVLLMYICKAVPTKIPLYSCRRDVLVHNCQLSAPSPMASATANRLDSFAPVRHMSIYHAHDVTSHTLARTETAKLKSGKFFVHGHMEQSAKFNFHQIFQPYGIWHNRTKTAHVVYQAIFLLGESSLIMQLHMMCPVISGLKGYFLFCMVRLALLHICSVAIIKVLLFCASHLFKMKISPPLYTPIISSCLIVWLKCQMNQSLQWPWP